MEKFLNIYFYNFFLISRFLSKILIIYLNPFIWIENFSKMKLGSKLFFEHMEKNFPNFLHTYKYIFKLKIYFIPLLTFFNLFIITILSLFLKINFANNFFIILLFSLLLSLIESYKYIFYKNKYQSYFIEFFETKQYNYPLLTLLILVSSLLLWINLVF